MATNYPQVVITPNLKLSLISMNDTLAENLIIIDNFAGTSSGSSISTGEVPTGLVNGVNTTYTLAHSPLSNSLAAYQNGSRLKLGTDYSISGTTITWSLAPFTGDLIQVDYRY